MMGKLAIIDTGTYYHHRVIHEDRFGHFFDQAIYIRDLCKTDLSAITTLIVPCRTDPAHLVAHRKLFADFLNDGKTVVAMGSTGPDKWLDDINWRFTPTNFWWWKEGGSLNLEIAEPEHSLFDYVKLADATWHHHGLLTPPAGATSLINANKAGSIFYDDRVTSPGRKIVTTLDPMYHHGNHFMPATSRFLDGFLPWLKSQ
ncbi:hypothetical protein [Thalassospira lucentensis]|uniref:hypothetical protein n=2 Tax=Thalassospira lucentensis TaxID=168935 RepID=UPI003D273615